MMTTPATTEIAPTLSFNTLGLPAPLLQALERAGYHTPSPIQAETIPHLLAGKDLIGQAQTGTGKTAAFALPLLSRLDLSQRSPQLLVLAPTRELAIQVADAFSKYGRDLPGLQVLSIYGGQDYPTQLRALKKGVQVVVGTPGRVMDHMRRGSLDLSGLKALVLDEADEMLRMGFIDDVEWVLTQVPAERQIALFSATMPEAIRRIAQQHLRSPVQVSIRQESQGASTIRQRYWLVQGMHKLDALSRILEAETFDGMIIFVRTKTATVELSDKLSERGYSSSPLNGDMSQAVRERTVDKLKKGDIDILVATDVVARGLDVERVSHVINYDIPFDTEAYIHRIGRTGRAGRSGDAVLFVAPRERRMLKAIERATGKLIEEMALPSAEQINARRTARFAERIAQVMSSEDLSVFEQLVNCYVEEHQVPAAQVAAALARLAHGDKPFLLQDKAPVRHAAASDGRSRERVPVARKPTKGQQRSEQDLKAVEQGMERYRMEVGYVHGVKPGNIVGAIANEADLESKFIGRISIFDDYSLIDLPEGMPRDVFGLLQNTRVAGQALRLSLHAPGKAPGKAPRKAAPAARKKNIRK